jgi:hypothetical protein
MARPGIRRGEAVRAGGSLMPVGAPSAEAETLTGQISGFLKKVRAA